MQLSNAEESFYKEKSRDKNTGYFHKCLVGIRVQNRMGHNHDSSGQLLEIEEEIREEMVGFYQQLLGEQRR